MKSLSAVIVLACMFLAASCVQGEERESAIERGAPLPTGAAAASGETTHEAQEQLPIVHFKPSEFPFVTTIRDDGTDKAGGWQVAKAELDFWKIVIPRGTTQWKCLLTIGMPLRTEVAGPIPPSHAATLSAQVAGEVAREMDYGLPTGIFCHKFVLGVRALFKSRYPKLGATVEKG